MAQTEKVGSGERAQYLVHDYNDNTVRFVLHYPGLVDPAILRAAAKAVVDSVSVLHSSFVTGSVGVHWQVNENVDISSYFQHIRTEGDPSVAARSLALLPVYPEDRCQMRCVLVQSDASSAIVVSISHLCVDGGDGKYLLNKLVEAYNLILESGSTYFLEVKNGNRSPEQVYEQYDLKDIKAMLNNPLGGVKTEFPFPSEEEGTVQMVRKTIPREVLSEARRKAKEDGASVNDLLIAACFHAYASIPGVNAGEAMSITNMMDLRRHCKDGESEGLSNMSGTMPTTLPHGIYTTFENTLREVASQTKAMKEDPLAGMGGMPILHTVTKVLPMGLLLKSVGKVYGSFSIGLTNLGNVSCQSLALGKLAPTDVLFGGPLKKKPGMQVSAISFDGECSLCVVGQYAEEDVSLIQWMLDRMVFEIKQYTA